MIWWCYYDDDDDDALSRRTMHVLGTMGAIHSTKIPTGPTGKIGPPQKVDPFFRNFSGWIEPIHWIVDRNFRKFWLNGSRPMFYSASGANRVI